MLVIRLYNLMWRWEWYTSIFLVCSFVINISWNKLSLKSLLISITSNYKSDSLAPSLHLYASVILSTFRTRRSPFRSRCSSQTRISCLWNGCIPSIHCPLWLTKKYVRRKKSKFVKIKVSILLYLKSSSGRIPAGSVNVSLNSIGQAQNKETYEVEKCPDKKAAVEMSLSCECLNEIDCVPKTSRSNKSE